MQLILSFHNHSSHQNIETDNKVYDSLQIANEDAIFLLNSTYTTNTSYGSATVVEIGHIPIAAVLDEEGEVVTEATFHDDYAVDVLFADDVMEQVSIAEVSPYIVEIDNPYHNFI